MNLLESVNLVIDDMDSRVKAGEKEFYADSVRGWLLALRIAVKAFQPSVPCGLDPHVLESVRRAQKRQQEKGKQTYSDYSATLDGIRFARCHDGEEVGVQVQIPQEMQLDHTVTVGKTIYRLDADGFLREVSE